MDQKLNLKQKAYDSPEKIYIQIKRRNKHSCILSSLHDGSLAPVQCVPTDAVNSFMLTTIHSNVEIFKASLQL